MRILLIKILICLFLPLSLFSQSFQMHPLRKLSVKGDFNGDGTKEILYQGNYSKVINAEIKNAPDPSFENWDDVVAWFYEQQSDVTLSFKGGRKLHLGVGQGLYCLINVGDLNKDGRDEIALVVDRCDQSRVNTCFIYSYCKNSWVVLKSFEILEDAFDYVGSTAPNFKIIKDYLELKKGKWYYQDYNKIRYNSSSEAIQKLRRLVISKCN